MTDGVVNIRGKEYKTVALRIQEFREKHPFWRIHTDLIESGNPVIIKATICDENGDAQVTGYAEENRDFGNINKTSAIENCETSAVGRALAFLGFAGSEIASADELATAIGQQSTAEHIDYMALVREHWDTIEFVKTQLATNEVDAAREAFKELEKETQMALWKAPTKGGVFTTLERDKLKQPEKYREAS